MKCIFEASSGLEAHMISNLLQQVGILARIDGEYLQGGVGELQAMGFVRVLVDDADYTTALQVIKAWDSTQSEPTKRVELQSKSPGTGIGLFLGFIIGVAVTFIAYNTPVTLDGIDHNEDGKLDEKLTYRDNRIVRAETDRNLDGLIDLISLFNRKGLVYNTEADDNFDGIFETTITYKRGNPLLQVIDTNQDGVIDIKSYFENGILTQIEILGPTSSSPKMKQQYSMSKLISSEFDSDGDGIYDEQYTYDYYEQIK